jgi:hypothetical protein
MNLDILDIGLLSVGVSLGLGVLWGLMKAVLLEVRLH